MSDSTHDDTVHTPEPGTPEAAGRRYSPLGVRVILLAGVAALGLGLAYAIPSWAKAGGFGWRGDGEFMEFMIERKLRHVDATDAQREAVLAIAAETREALLALRGDDAPHEAFVEQLVADPGDADELEALRLAGIDRFDEGSRILVDALARVAAVLTPEQRETLAELHRERREHHRRWHH